MTPASLADLPSRLYEMYASRHVFSGGDEAAAVVYRRDIRALPPPPAAGPVVDPACGRGTLHELLKDRVRLAWMAGHASEWTGQAFAPEYYAQLAVRKLL